MPNLQEIRAKYPQYNDMDDVVFVDKFYNKFYSDMPREQFNSKIGIKQDYSGIGEGVRAGIQGATLGLGEEIAGVGAGIGGGIAGLVAGQPIVETAKKAYGEEVAERRTKQKAFTKDYPKTALASELAGGFAMPGAGAMGKFIGGGTMGGRAVRAGGVGAGVGAGYGLGSEGDIEERALSGLQGAVGGAIGGTILTPALEKTIAVGLGLGGSGLTKIDKFIREYVEPENISKFIKTLEGAKDRNVILADIAGGNLQQAIRRLRSAGGKTVVDELAEKRAIGELGRVSKQTGKLLTDKPYYETLDTLKTEYKERAKPLYDVAKKTAIPRSQSLEDVLEGVLAPTKKGAKDILQMRRDKLSKQAIELESMFPEDIYGKQRSFIEIDSIKRSLDNLVGKTRRTGEVKTTSAASKLRKDLLKEADALSPTYKEARKISSDYFQLRDAQEAGLDFKNLDAEDIKRLFKGMSEANQDAYRIGVKKSLKRDMMKKPDTGSVAKAIFNNPVQRERLQTIFGKNQEEFAKFAQSLQDELTASKTQQAVTGGSQTAENLTKSAIESILSGMRHPKTTAGNVAFSTAKRLGRAEPKKLAQQLMQSEQAPNIESLKRILQANLKRTKKNKLAQKFPAGRLAGQLAGRK